MAREITEPTAVRQVLLTAKTIAVLGAHPQHARPASYVPAYLQNAGYRIVPVNPRFVGEEMFGAVTVAKLADVHEAVDVVDVFRPSELLAGHLADILAMEPRPKLVWLQSGIENDDVAGALVAAGIDVIQDRCMLAEHRRSGL